MNGTLSWILNNSASNIIENDLNSLKYSENYSINLLNPMINWKDVHYRGLTISRNSDDSIKYKGTATKLMPVRCKEYLSKNFNVPAGEYIFTLSGDWGIFPYEKESGSFLLSICTLSGSYAISSVAFGQNPYVTFTIPEEYANKDLTVILTNNFVKAGVSYDFTVYPMIMKYDSSKDISEYLKVNYTQYTKSNRDLNSFSQTVKSEVLNNKITGIADSDGICYLDFNKSGCNFKTNSGSELNHCGFLYISYMAYDDDGVLIYNSPTESLVSLYFVVMSEYKYGYSIEPGIFITPIHKSSSDAHEISVELDTTKTSTMIVKGLEDGDDVGFWLMI